MSLLPDGCFVNGMWFNSCQLQKIHWITRVNDTVICHLRRDGLGGEYPLLRSGEKEFIYASCTHLDEDSVECFEGSFTFVPDRLEHPNGAPFEVEVGRFSCQRPDYIF
ncbi:SKP1/ASK-interacting protein 16 [Euphorbia peplus]|nr:SKP1/ASK-interacting protein 16 [Euphorbia peplus]